MIGTITVKTSLARINDFEEKEQISKVKSGKKLTWFIH
jgi:hypothetical protein